MRCAFSTTYDEICTVHNRIGKCGSNCDTSRAASKPFMPGIIKSRTSTSGCSSRTHSTASRPPSASPQTCQSQWLSMSWRSARRTIALSSAIRILILIITTALLPACHDARLGCNRDVALLLQGFPVCGITKVGNNAPQRCRATASGTLPDLQEETKGHLRVCRTVRLSTPGSWRVGLYLRSGLKPLRAEPLPHELWPAAQANQVRDLRAAPG